VPTYADVWCEVKKFIQPASAEDTDEAFRKYRDFIEEIKAGVRNASKIMDGRALDYFFIREDKLSRDQRRRMGNTLYVLVQKLSAHLEKFEAAAQEDSRTKSKLFRQEPPSGFLLPLHASPSGKENWFLC
jgi:hypothetical protein